MDVEKKIILGLIKAEIAGGLVLLAWLYAKTQYYKGRIDCANEIKEKIVNIMKEVDEKYASTKEES